MAQSVAGGNAFIFDESGCGLYKNTTRQTLAQSLDSTTLLAVGDLKKPGLYIMRTVNAPPPEQARLSLTELHTVLGHRHIRDCKKLAQPGRKGRPALLHGVELTDDQNDPFCTACAVGKGKRQPLPKKNPGHYKVRELSELIHSDVCGPFQIMSIESKAYYFVSFIEDRSRMKFVYLLKTKSEVFAKWAKFSSQLERQTGKKIKVLRYDNAGEQLCVEFQTDLNNRGIQQQRTCSGNSNQNQVAEKWNGTALDGVRTLLAEARLPMQFWGHALLTIAYLSQFWSHPTIPNTTVHEQFYGTAPTIEHLRPFGCDAYAVDHHAHKLQDRSKRYIFVGYGAKQKGYKLYDEDTGRTSVHRHGQVEFDTSSYNGRTIDDHWGETYENDDPHDDDYSPAPPLIHASDSDDSDNGCDNDDNDPERADHPLRCSSRLPQPRQFLQPMLNSDDAIAALDDDRSVSSDHDASADDIDPNVAAVFAKQRERYFMTHLTQQQQTQQRKPSPPYLSRMWPSFSLNIQPTQPNWSDLRPQPGWNQRGRCTPPTLIPTTMMTSSTSQQPPDQSSFPALIKKP